MSYLGTWWGWGHCFLHDSARENDVYRVLWRWLPRSEARYVSLCFIFWAIRTRFVVPDIFLQSPFLFVMLFYMWQCLLMLLVCERPVPCVWSPLSLECGDVCLVNTKCVRRPKSAYKKGAPPFLELKHVTSHAKKRKLDEAAALSAKKDPKKKNKSKKPAKPVKLTAKQKREAALDTLRFEAAVGNDNRVITKHRYKVELSNQIVFKVVYFCHIFFWPTCCTRCGLPFHEFVLCWMLSGNMNFQLLKMWMFVSGEQTALDTHELAALEAHRRWSQGRSRLVEQIPMGARQGPVRRRARQARSRGDGAALQRRSTDFRDARSRRLLSQVVRLESVPGRRSRLHPTSMLRCVPAPPRRGLSATTRVSSSKYSKVDILSVVFYMPHDLCSHLPVRDYVCVRMC